MAFLTAAEAVVAAQSQASTEPVSNFKVLVISDSDAFPVMKDVKDFFQNADVEINAVDLSKTGSTELQMVASMPLTRHYFHTPVIHTAQQTVVSDVCASLSKGKRLTPSKFLSCFDQSL